MVTLIGTTGNGRPEESSKRAARRSLRRAGLSREAAKHLVKILNSKDKNLIRIYLLDSYFSYLYNL